MVDHLFNNKFNLKWNDKENGYHIAPSNDSSFFPDRQANIFLKGKLVGVIYSLYRFSVLSIQRFYSILKLKTQFLLLK